MKRRTQYRWACNGLIAFCFFFANTTVLDAAAIKPYSDAVMGCTIQVSGTLIEGDAERFTQLAGEPTYDERRVKEFVNLRSNANFDAPVVRQVPVKELVRVLNPDTLTVIGPEGFRKSCIIACRAFGDNQEDWAARDRAQQCIDDHLLWYEVADAQNNRGWVSRKFLEEVE